LFLYFSISFYISFKKAVEQSKIRIILILPITFMLIHISYGYGYIIGIIKFIMFNKRKINVKLSR
jgi:hypothetical protein